VGTPKRMALVGTLLQEQKVESIDELYLYGNQSRVAGVGQVVVD
jgi:hypothetical protein